MNDIKKKRIRLSMRIVGIILSVLICIFNFTPYMVKIRQLPATIFTDSETSIEGYGEKSGLLLTAASDAETLGSRSISIKLFDLIELRRINVYVCERGIVHPCGETIGISIRMKGVMVVGNGSFVGINGKKCSPSADCGLRPGDVVLSVNNIPVNTATEFQKQIEDSSSVILSIERNGKGLKIEVTPEFASDGSKKIGAWVRDSTVGIGTLSFVDCNSDKIAALGHAIIDSDTGKMITVRTGKMVRAKLVGIQKGRSGVPGELQGTFDSSSRQFGSIEQNSEICIFGTVDDKFKAECKATLPVAFPNEVKKGDAYILSGINDDKIEKYTCRIIKTVNQSEADSKGMVIEITDDRLLESTGGIVQGMSGSPIIQNGKIVGVVTHVFINDPKKGYGVYAFWMYELINAYK